MLVSKGEVTNIQSISEEASGMVVEQRTSEKDCWLALENVCI